MPDNTQTTKRTQRNGPALRRARAGWEMRVSGASWEQIATELGFANRSNAFRSVYSYLGRVPEFDAEAERAVWRARLEWLWSRARKDVIEQRPGAVTAGVRVAQQAARLSGLNAVEPVLHDPSDAEVLRWLNDVLSYTPTTVVEADVIHGDGYGPAAIEGQVQP